MAMGEGDRNSGGHSSSRPPARACACPCKTLGEQFSALLSEPHAHQLGVCGRLRIPYRTYKDWMAKQPEPGSPLEEFQGIVLEALDRARVRDLQNIVVTVEAADNAKASTLANVLLHSHKNRFKRFEEAAKSEIELSGPDGAPLQTQAVPPKPLDPLEAMERVKELAEAGDERAIALLEAARKA